MGGVENGLAWCEKLPKTFRCVPWLTAIELDQPFSVLPDHENHLLCLLSIDSLAPPTSRAADSAGLAQGTEMFLTVAPIYINV